MKLNLKAISIYEGIKKVSFSEFDFNSEDDFFLLLYAMYEAKENRKESFEAFKGIMQTNANLLKELSAECTKVYLYNKQFEEQEKEPEDKQKQTEKPLLSKLANTLIALGLDAYFVLYDLELWQLPLLAESLEEKKREQWERERLWTFIGILPYVGKDDFTPQKLFSLPWETKEKERELEETFHLIQSLAKIKKE